MDYTFNINEEDGRYYANIYCPGDRWRTRLSLMTTQKSVARQRLAKWERMWARGEWDPRKGRPSQGDRLPLSRAIQLFLETYREEVREITASNMESALSMLSKAVGAETPVAHIGPEDIQTFIQNLSSHANDAPPGSAAMSTKAQKYSYLARFFGWLMETGKLARNPMEKADRPRVDDASSDSFKVLSPSEATRLLRAVEATDGPTYFQRFLEVALASGLRLGELRHMRWELVDLSVLRRIDPAAPRANELVEISVEPVEDSAGLWRPKNRYSIRSLPVYPRGAAVLAVLWSAQDRPEKGWVWAVTTSRYEGERPTRGRLQELMRESREAAGMGDVTIHDLRHTWFSWLLNDLGLARKAPSVSRMGGHGRIEQTWGYVTASDQAQRDAVHESLGLQAPEGQEEAVRSFLTSAPIGTTETAKSGV